MDKLHHILIVITGQYIGSMWPLLYHHHRVYMSDHHQVLLALTCKLVVRDNNYLAPWPLPSHARLMAKSLLKSLIGHEHKALHAHNKVGWPRLLQLPCFPMAKTIVQVFICSAYCAYSIFVQHACDLY